MTEAVATDAATTDGAEPFSGDTTASGGIVIEGLSGSDPQPAAIEKALGALKDEMGDDALIGRASFGVQAMAAWAPDTNGWEYGRFQRASFSDSIPGWAGTASRR